MARPRLHDDAVRTRLLQVATAAISDGGVGAVTVRDVARRAGTSSSAVYSLFGSREALLRTVGDEAFDRFAARLDSAPRSGDPAADLLALGLAYRAHALAEPQVYRVMFSTAGAGAQDPGRQPAAESAPFGALRAAVAATLGPGRDPEEPALGLWALVHGLVELELDGLLPGDEPARAARYAAVLRAAGPGILGAAGTAPR